MRVFYNYLIWANFINTNHGVPIAASSARLKSIIGEDDTTVTALPDAAPPQSSIYQSTDPLDHPVTIYLPQELDEAFRLRRARRNIFNRATILSPDGKSAIVLNKAPKWRAVKLLEVVDRYKLPDLIPALSKYFFPPPNPTGATRRWGPSQPTRLPPGLTYVNIWESFRVQQKSTQDPDVLPPPQTVQALAPTPEMIYGRANVVLLDESEGKDRNQGKQILLYRPHANS
jgi:hypothetical protein